MGKSDSDHKTNKYLIGANLSCFLSKAKAKFAIVGCMFYVFVYLSFGN